MFNCQTKRTIVAFFTAQFASHTPAQFSFFPRTLSEGLISIVKMLITNEWIKKMDDSD